MVPDDRKVARRGARPAGRGEELGRAEHGDFMVAWRKITFVLKSFTDVI